jgi:hypothetical protein
MPDNYDWLEGCDNWSGQEASLPAGMNSTASVNVLQLIKSWDVLDASADAGFRTVKLADLKKGDVIVGAEPNNNSIIRILQTFGIDAFRFAPPDGHGQMNAEQWVAAYGTNPFTLLAIMRKRKELMA